MPPRGQSMLTNLLVTCPPTTPSNTHIAALAKLGNLQIHLPRTQTHKMHLPHTAHNLVYTHTASFSSNTHTHTHTPPIPPIHTQTDTSSSSNTNTQTHTQCPPTHRRLAASKPQTAEQRERRRCRRGNSSSETSATENTILEARSCLQSSLSFSLLIRCQALIHYQVLIHYQPLIHYQASHSHSGLNVLKP